MEAGCSGRSHCRNRKQRTGFFSLFLCYRRNNGGGNSDRTKLSSPVSSRSYDDGRHEERRQPHFLEVCFLCKKPLRGNRDIFMYRGDTPFCSEKCRYKQIVLDEVNEKRLKLSATFKALHTGTAAITSSFRKDRIWNTEHGQFFLVRYSGMQLDHGDRLLSAAKGTFHGTGAKLSGKVAGIHWHYNTGSHAAELTAGYDNTRHRDGYLPIARMFSKHGVVFNFTCMEMRDGDQPHHANCSPEGLVRQVNMAMKTAWGELSGENALERYDGSGYAQVLATSRSDSGNGLTAFTYLRMNKRLFEGTIGGTWWSL